MSRIHIMPEILASQVAAGEVVERPASVIKELVENSLDAGATTISVDILRGGVLSMKVTDDGSGMSPEDAALCVQRHATSKLMTVEDLFEIAHLGFRGEALPSIASVSKLTIRTREPASLEGCELRVEGGIVQEPRSCGMPPGTSIEIADLFFNTPARRKFLKSEETETAHIEHQLRLHALAFPHVRFIFNKNGHTSFDLPATDDPRERIAALSDRETAEALLCMAPEYGPGVTVNGYLMPLSETRRSRKGQFIFLNKRPIDDKLVTRAIRDGYGGLPAGLHPSLYLYIDIEPALVDVNVHPAKREVRFRRPADVVTTVIEAISSTLSRHAAGASDEPSCVLREPPPVLTELSRPVTTSAPSTPASQSERHKSAPRAALIKPPAPVQAKLDMEPAAPPFPFRLIGSLQGKYALFEGSEGLVVLFPQAARERIIFETLMQDGEKPLVAQTLLEPIMLELDPRDFALLHDLLPHFDRAGISLVPFGARTMRVESLPPMLKLSDARAFVLDLIDRIGHAEWARKASRTAYETFAGEVAKKSSRFEKTDLTHATPLLKELLQCDVPYCTPSGKPTLVMYSLPEIARKFGLS